MSIEKKHIIYSAEDIKRYLTGGMAPADMHAIEMAALDDPLLAEAIEGYEGMEQKDWSKELLALSNQLHGVKNSPVIPLSKAPAFKWQRAAAAILVIGCTVATAYIFTNNNKNQASIVAKQDSGANSNAVAVLEPAFENKPSIPDVSGTTAAAGNTTVASTPNQTNSTTPQLATADTKTKADSSFIYKPAPAAAADFAVNDAATESTRDTESREDIAVAPAAKAARNNAAASEASNENNAFSKKETADKFKNSNNANAPANNFYGQVVTPGNEPVSFANVQLPNNKNGVHTDANGRFNIASTDSVVNVTVSSMGYNAQKVTLQHARAENTIVLQPKETQLTESIVIAGNGRAKVKKLPPVADSTDEEEEDDYAAPAGGWAEYNNYLSNNLVMPGEAKRKNIHGEVEVSVQLKNNGEISRVRVAKPLCASCDAEALRLVKEGPKFEVKNNRAKKVKVRVKF
jgi:TonB family protein